MSIRTVALALKQLHDSALGELLLERHGLEDFLKFCLNEVLTGTRAMEPLEGLLRSLMLILHNLVTWTLRDQPDQEQLDDGREGLKDAGRLPAPLALHLERPVSWKMSALGPFVDLDGTHVVQAAMMDPRYQRVLYMVVSFPRYWGCEISVINMGEQLWV